MKKRGFRVVKHSDNGAIKESAFGDPQNSVYKNTKQYYSQLEAEKKKLQGASKVESTYEIKYPPQSSR